jgi:hypothetical protein
MKDCLEFFGYYLIRTWMFLTRIMEVGSRCFLFVQLNSIGQSGHSTFSVLLFYYSRIYLYFQNLSCIWALILTSLSSSRGPGDLFIDGRVIHRPQFQFTERQQVRSRPRPRYDRRRETMQVERRETMQRGPPAQQQGPLFSQEPAQNSEQSYGTMPPGVGKWLQCRDSLTKHLLLLNCVFLCVVAGQ